MSRIQERHFEKGLPNSKVKYQIKDIIVDYDNDDRVYNRDVSNARIYSPSDFLTDWAKLLPKVNPYNDN